MKILFKKQTPPPPPPPGYYQQWQQYPYPLQSAQAPQEKKEKRKTAGDVIHENYLKSVRILYWILFALALSAIGLIVHRVIRYFQENTKVEIGADLIIVTIISSSIYYAYKKVKGFFANRKGRENGN